MKKNISINISGILFHIEEDGYEQLKKYLESISSYFSEFEGSSEIIADIEGRIAEIFLEKLNENKQVITQEDVTGLMATMGSIKDFEALEEDEPLEQNKQAPDQETPEPDPWSIPKDKKRLYRDNQRKILGGVASGIAHYFSIDPVWIRLAFILLLFDAFLSFALAPLSVVAYMVLWIAVPASDSLEEDKTMKKLFRNPEGKVLGGVAQGLATYVGIDVALVRIIFVLTIFLGGTGLFVYLVLWAIIPEASSITDKVMMEGDKVTLENIDSSIKKAQEKEAQPHQESVFAKIFLFPFRLLGTIFTGLSKAVKPILVFFATLVRVFIGALIGVVGLSILFALTIVVIAAFGILAGTHWVQVDFMPLYMISDSIPAASLIGGYLAAAIPALLLVLVGASLIIKKSVIGPGFGWAAFGLWIIGLAMLAATIPNVLFNYKETANISKTEVFNTSYQAMYFDVNNTGVQDYDGVSLTLEGYDGNQVKLVKEYIAKGASKTKAAKNTEMFTYEVAQNDSVLVFDENISFKPKAVYRNQYLKLKLLVPYRLKFGMNPHINKLLRYGMSHYGYRKSEIEGNVFYFNETGLDCTTCLTSKSNEEQRRSFYEEVLEESTATYGNSKKYPLTEFTKINIEGPFEASIAQGDEYRVVMAGSERYLEKVKVTKQNNQLYIGVKGDSYMHRVKVRIIMPTLSAATFKEAAEVHIAGFNEEDVALTLSSASQVVFDGNITTLTLKMSSASNVELMGQGVNLDARLSSAARLDAYKFMAQNVSVKATSAAKANVFATKTLTINATTLGEVNYRGGAQVTKERTSTLGRVSEE